MTKIEKLLKSHNIVYHVVYLDPGINGLVYKSRKKYHIFISDTLSPKGQLEVLFHEMHHILSDAPSKPYFIGLDMQREVFEGQADLFARELLASYAFQ